MPERTSVTLNFVERGAGTPVLALHGWTPDHRLMLGCLEPVFANRPGYRRLYPDLPGMGKSPAPPTIASSDDLVDAVQDFIDDTIGDEPFLLIAESYGGYLARALTRARARQVLGLTLICPIGNNLDKADRVVPERQVLRPDPELLASLDDDRIGEELVVQTPETTRRFREEILAGIDLADTAAIARIKERWQLAEHPPEGDGQFDRPSLILTGRQDASTGYVEQFALLPHYPRATYVVLDVAGHNLQIEQPALLDALIGEWLDRVADESGQAR